MEKVNTGDGGAAAAKKDSTSMAANSAISSKSAKKSTAKTPDAARWLDILFQTITDCQRAGINVQIVNATSGGSVVVLRGVYWCEAHERFTRGDVCAACASTGNVLATAAPAPAEAA